MDGYIRLGILITAAVILFVMLIDSRKRAKQQYTGDDETPGIFDSKNNLEISFLKKSATEESPSQLSLPLDQEVKIVRHKPAGTAYHADLITLAVMAKPGGFFASYDLLQAISSAGLQYGDMNIFHYFHNTPEGNELLFSLASANEPGEFDLNQIGDFSCSGLVLFMKLSRLSEPEASFNKMLTIAQQLADVLDGVVKADPRTPWSPAIARQYQEKVKAAEMV